MLLIAAWLRNDKRRAADINERALQLRKGFWGVISSLSEQKTSMTSWWPCDGDPVIRLVSQRRIDNFHKKVVSINWVPNKNKNA